MVVAGPNISYHSDPFVGLDLKIYLRSNHALIVPLLSYVSICLDIYIIGGLVIADQLYVFYTFLKKYYCIIL